MRKSKYTEEEKSEKFVGYFCLGMCLLPLFIMVCTYLRDGTFILR